MPPEMWPANLDEFWEVPRGFLAEHDLEPGREHVRDLDWFTKAYAVLAKPGVLKARDPGGSAANTIAALARMGWVTGFFGSTGAKDADDLRLAELGAAENLRIVLRDVPAGRCLSLIDSADSHRDRALVILPNANNLAGSGGMDIEYFERARWVHLTSFVSDRPLKAQIELVERLSGRPKISFDPGAVYVDKGFAALEPILRRTDVLFAAEEELTPEQRRMIFRPRTTPILTRYETLKGPRYVWTTFSPDQIDLNYKNPKVLLSFLFRISETIIHIPRFSVLCIFTIVKSPHDCSGIRPSDKEYEV